MALLETRGLTIRFGGNLAVSDVDLSVEAGSVTGLIGPNGAGKTTTFNMISGVLHPSAGDVLLDGSSILKLKPHKRARKGIGRTFQRLEVFSSLTVRDNILVGCEIRQAWARSHPANAQLLAEGRDDLTTAEEVDLILESIGLADHGDTNVGSLSTGRARLVELGRSLAIRPRVLLLDEPASGLDDHETEEFGELLVRLAGSGLAILMVEHDVPLVMKVCSTIFVLDFGHIIASGLPSEIQANEAVLNAYLGSAK